jgi:peptide chain release factor
MGKLGVRSEKEEQILSQMIELGIREEDIIEKFIRSGGSGGQNVNKTSTSVQIKHVPTGIVVKSQKARTQGLNRFLARRILISRIERLLGKRSLKDREVEKMRKQKKRRKRRAKMKRSL